MITPGEILTLGPTPERFAELEARIDAEIKRCYAEQPEYRRTVGVWIGVSLFRNGAERKVIEEKYRAAGWSVRYQGDQRDGDALVFELPKGMS